jgi:predicted kinase
MSKLIRRIIKESIDEFDWVDTNTSNLSGKRLYDMMTELFNLNNSMYQIKQSRSGIIDISDDSGVYLEYNMEDFTIDRIREDLTAIINDYNIHPETRLEYSELAKALEPIIGTMEYYH